VSLADEFFMLLKSDMSSAAIDQLVTRPGLWIRNTLVHFAMGYVGCHVWLQSRKSRRVLLCFVAGYCALQIIQLFSPGRLSVLVLDGFFDVFVLNAGWAAAFVVAMKGVSDDA